MADKGKKVYRSRNPVKIVVSVFVGLIVAVIVIAVALFFYLQKFIVVKDGDVKLEVPFLVGTETEEETPEPDLIIEE